MKTDLLATEDLCKSGKLKVFCTVGTAHRRFIYDGLQQINTQFAMCCSKNSVNILKTACKIRLKQICEIARAELQIAKDRCTDIKNYFQILKYKKSSHANR